MAKSIAPQDILELTNLLSQSGLLTSEALEQAYQLADETSTVPVALQRWIAAELLSPWQATQLAAGQFILKLGSYHLIQESRPWDFGRAFQARHRQTQRDVTLKLLANRWLQPEETWRETSAHLRIAQKLESPHLSIFSHVSRAAQRTFLISELEPSDDMIQLLQRHGSPSPDQAARILREAAVGLDALHRWELTHGALRPACVTLTANGTVRLVDIGLAHLAPSLFDFLRNSLPTSDTPQTLDPRFTLPKNGIGDVSLTRWDVILLARIGLLLLDEMAHLPPSQHEVPAWWSGKTDDTTQSREKLRAILTEASESADPTWSAQRLREALEKKAKPPAPKPLAAKTAKVSTAILPQTTTAEPNKPRAGVVIDTQRRRRRTAPADDERTAALRRLHRRRAAWLYLSISMTVVGLLVMVAITFWPAGGIRLWAPKVAERQNAEAQPELAGAGGGAAANEELGLPDPDSLGFPTPEMFAAAQPENRPESAPSNAASDIEGPDLPDSVPAEQNTAAMDTAATDIAATDIAAMETAANSAMPDEAMPKPEEKVELPVPSTTTPNVEVPDTPADSPEPEATPPTPATPPQFLANLPPRVAIPEPREAPSDSPVTLLPLKLEPNHVIEVSLLGGEHILKGNPTLRLEHADGGTAERTWDVLLVDRTGPPTPVAEFHLDQDQLFFRWQPASQNRTEAVQLMNCALNITLGTETHRMFLRHPVEAPAPTMDFVRGISSIRWDIPHAPETTQCRLELVGLEGSFPESRQFPSESLGLSPAKQDYWILVGLEPEEQVLTFHVETQTRRQLELSVTSLFFAGEAPPAPQMARNREARITTANRRRWLATAQGRLVQAGQQLAALNAIDPNSAGARTSQQELARLKNLAQLDLEAARRDAARVETLEQLASSMHDVGKLHFRVYFEFAGNQVDLLHTSKLSEGN